MISNLKVDSSGRNISWMHSNLTISKSFKMKVFQVVEIKFLNQILIISDCKENGEKNMFIYNENGYCIANPKMPSSEFYGVYSIWYRDNNKLQTVVLLSNDNTSYEKKCEFNLENYVFSNFSETK
ncbi:hypothetical protein [Gilliamella apicola]|uniref:Uncharacterized protein n=1 Tax=Gilliamella apicola TaxID=1196095 RepID=A0A2V4EH46_9GAMM|nr:hypothetical protein [Gilliamella apicola]PXZ03968.1 hypothetical protein DKK79_06205 [Gilliamella apicola]